MGIPKKIVYIRADANETIGTGHVMRCLSIAEALRKQGGDAVFLVADTRTEDIIKNRGFSAVCLHSVWNDLEKETERLVSLIRKKEIGVLLIDTYYVTPDYLETLRQYTKLVYIDDLNAFAYSVDMLISYAVYYSQDDYEKYYRTGKVSVCRETGSRKSCQMAGNPARRPVILSGSRYIPLKSQFCHLPERKISECVKNVLVLTGGTDPYHVALKLAKNFAGAGETCNADAGKVCNADAKKYKELQFHIVCGKYNMDYEKLCRVASETENITIHYNIDCMADYMMQADLAVTAGGTTTYELCACGTPSVCYVLADNQIQNARSLAEKRLMLFGGDVRKEGGISEILRQMNRLSADVKLRQAMSEKMRQLVDGKGAMRIAEAILKKKEEGLQ